MKLTSVSEVYHELSKRLEKEEQVTAKWVSPGWNTAGVTPVAIDTQFRMVDGQLVFCWPEEDSDDWDSSLVDYWTDGDTIEVIDVPNP